jgi:hypothetical protein
MKDENQENEALQGPVILTLPASLTVPGFGFLVALNPDWRFYLAREEGKLGVERWVATLRLCQASNHHSPKAFRIARSKRDASG